MSHLRRTKSQKQSTIIPHHWSHNYLPDFSRFHSKFSSQWLPIETNNNQNVNETTPFSRHSVWCFPGKRILTTLYSSNCLWELNSRSESYCNTVASFSLSQDLISGIKTSTTSNFGELSWCRHSVSVSLLCRYAWFKIGPNFVWWHFLN